MRDEDLREEFADWLRPVREAEPPELPLIKRRLRRRRSWHAVAGVITLGAVAGIIVAVHPSTGGPHPAASSRVGPATAAPTVSAASTRPSPIYGGYQRTVRYTVTAPVRTLVVRGGLGNVTITGSQRSTVSVTTRMRYSRTAPELTRNLAAGTLTLASACPHESMCDASYNVEVPRGITVKASGNDGLIRLASLAGPVTASSSLGAIKATGLTCGTADFTATNGQIDAAFTAAPYRVHAAAALGQILIHVPATVSYHTSLQADLGMTRVSVPQSSSSPHSISATANLGAISIVPEG